MQAKAIVFRVANEPLLEEISIPNPSADELVVKIHYSGVSIGTESSIFSGARTSNGTFPLVGGYMASGVVEQIGSAVTTFNVGDKVAVGGTRLDGDINSIWGGHTSVQVVQAAGTVKIPEGTAMTDASMHILPRVGLNAVSMAGITEQDTVLITGQGLIGQFFGQFARARGAKVITVEPDKLRAELSRKYVTEYVLDPNKDDIGAEIDKITHGAGPTVVVEATASSKLIHNSTQFLREYGKMVFLSWYPGSIEIDFAHFHNNTITTYFPMGAGNNATTRAVLTGMKHGTVIIGDNLTDIYPFTEACDGYRRLATGDRSVMGMVIDWRNA